MTRFEQENSSIDTKRPQIVWPLIDTEHMRIKISILCSSNYNKWFIGLRGKTTKSKRKQKKAMMPSQIMSVANAEKQITFSGFAYLSCIKRFPNHPEGLWWQHWRNLQNKIANKFHSERACRKQSHYISSMIMQQTRKGNKWKPVTPFLKYKKEKSKIQIFSPETRESWQSL